VGCINPTYSQGRLCDQIKISLGTEPEHMQITLSKLSNITVSRVTMNNHS